QHAARSLELDERGPVLVEPVEDFRMNRVGSLNSFLVVAALALGRELGGLGSILVGERASGHVTLLECLRSGQWLEQAPTDDLEALLGGRGSPGRFDASHDVPQPVERLTPANATDLHIIGLSVRRALG